ncbi:endonuclease/exonuclease/phosphatase family protein [Rhodospirillaceae bacterium KN72]|uniref:Endonuclease/exonuclease/phosphatase family protein n=1 Tax=Pacificispira spongiicola TaxID=2729598 RepID=A0A7Y0DY36_9PROT|nr:endonuclease/exonuclease/phosphatase family protein [Pacificispira spongiicola]NMM43735.1 endonuclease/exonuclease/phosphatase family protein [Pacificispira spongiicola]
MTFRYDFSAVGPDFPTSRVAKSILRFKEYAAVKGLPRKTLEHSLLMASWNIKHLGGVGRTQEALWYIAEILSSFDIIAVQEVKRKLDDLEAVLSLMGPWWRYVVTDVTEGTDGNDERLAYVYDSRKVEFSGLAGELVVPPIENADGTETPAIQFDRSPFLAGFSAGWFKFQLATVHLAWATAEFEDPDRVREADTLAAFMKRRAETDIGTWARNVFLIGDFNFFNPTSQAFRAMIDHGFTIPVGRQELEQSNAGAKARFYDQIAYYLKDADIAPSRMGVLNLFEAFYTDAQFEADFEPWITKADGSIPSDKRKYYRTYYRRDQLSDHFPLWIELPIDFGNAYLKRHIE